MDGFSPPEQVWREGKREGEAVHPWRESQGRHLHLQGRAGGGGAGGAVEAPQFPGPARALKQGGKPGQNRAEGIAGQVKQMSEQAEASRGQMVKASRGQLAIDDWWGGQLVKASRC